MYTSTSLTPTHNTQSTAQAARNARQIEGIYRAPNLHWVGDGFRVAGYSSVIPQAARKLDPFLLLDYHPSYDYSPSSRRRGVGVHPHRGFETVTLAWQGSVAHHDSAGGGGIIGPGDVQWMTAASGILHKEYHEQSYSERGGPFQMAQLWVNLPRAHKMAPPRYQPLLATEMGIVNLPAGAGVVRVVAGEYQSVKGPAKTFTPIHVLDATISAQGSFELTFPSHYNTGLLVMKGDITINGETPSTEGDFAVFENVGESISITADPDAHILVLSGEPINEPIVQYGPFVMNSETEIDEAIADFNRGRFGELDD